MWIWHLIWCSRCIWENNEQQSVFIKLQGVFYKLWVSPDVYSWRHTFLCLTEIFIFGSTSYRARGEGKFSTKILLIEQLNACHGCVMEVICPQFVSQILGMKHKWLIHSSVWFQLLAPKTWAMWYDFQNDASIYVTLKQPDPVILIFPTYRNIAFTSELFNRINVECRGKTVLSLWAYTWCYNSTILVISSTFKIWLSLLVKQRKTEVKMCSFLKR